MPLWLIQLLIVIVLQIIAYLLMPKPAQPKPAAATAMETPTSDAGRPIPILFGRIEIKSLNVLSTSDKSIRRHKIKA